MSTTRKIISDAFIFGGISQDPDNQQVAMALDGLNSIINQYNAEKLFHWLVQEVAYTPTSDSITVGVGGNIDIPRPISIDKIYVSIGGESFTEVQQVAFQDLRIYSNGSSGYPSVFSYSGYPIATIKFDVSPTTEVRLFIRPAFELLTIDDDLEMPPEYETLIRWALTAHLCRIYSSPNIEIATKARDEEMDRIHQASYSRTPTTTPNRALRMEFYNLGWC